MKKRRANRVTRRKVVKGMLAACVAGGAADALAAPATTQADAVTPDDLAAADRVAGRPYSPAQLKQMAGIVTNRRKKYHELRGLVIDPNTSPAMRFDPRLADTQVPVGTSLLKRSEDDPEPSKEQIPFATIGQLAGMIRSKKITSSELTKLYLSRLKDIGSRLLCVVNLMEERRAPRSGAGG